MNLYDKLEKEVRKHFHGAKGCHDWEHTERVLSLAVHIANKEKADMRVVKLAALLHDTARELEDKNKGKLCHAIKGAEMSVKMLKKYRVDDKTIDAVYHCISTHRFRGKLVPETLEAKVLFDADKLDSIGAVGIGRAFLFAGEFGAKLHNKDTDLSKTKPYTKEDTAWREFNVKLKHIKDRMLTKEGRRLARERHDFMEMFFSRLNKEASGII